MLTSIVILAAGKGKRMNSSCPKVLHKICGKEMIFYVIKEAKKISDDITVILYHDKDLIQECINKYFANINYKIQDYKNYPGTAGALFGLSFKHDKVFILNADMPLVRSDSLKEFFNINSDINIGILSLKNSNGYGKVIIKDCKVKKIIEQKDCSREELSIKNVNAGVYLFSKNILDNYLTQINNQNNQDEYYLTDIIELCQKNGKKITPIFLSEHIFKGVNNMLDKAQAQEIMNERIKEKWLLQGVSMRMPQSIYIEEGVKFKGECNIEQNVSVLGDCMIDNAHIKQNTVIENSNIINSSIGPFARVRLKSSITDSHIGNFVEVKKSTLNGIKAGHLSYLGDSDIQEGTNIGAGVITCNYDGKNKHKTTIGKNVFVGSDTQIIAPVKIEDKVIIAAGSTITKNVKSGDLAISRKTQENKKGFFDRFFEEKL